MLLGGTTPCRHEPVPGGAALLHSVGAAALLHFWALWLPASATCAGWVRLHCRTGHTGRRRGGKLGSPHVVRMHAAPSCRTVRVLGARLAAARAAVPVAQQRTVGNKPRMARQRVTTVVAVRNASRDGT